jgi:thymidylate kinase
MKIAIGIFGFIRENIYDNEWLSFFKLFSDDIKIDVYICTPDILHEFEKDMVDFEYIKTTLLKNPMIENVFIRDYKYVSQIFINQANELNLARKTADNLYPYRIISLFSAISKISKEIREADIEYDFVVLTRFDMLKLVYSIGADADYELYKDKSAIFGYRQDTSQIEDRLIITGEVGLEKLSNLYDTYHKIENIATTQFVSEYILRTYLLQYANELNIYYNSKIILGLGNTHHKYTSEVETKINEIYLCG